MLFIVLMISALVQLQTNLIGAGLDLWVLVDRSSSVEELLTPRLSEFESILEKSRGVDDSIRYVDFAKSVMLRATGEEHEFHESRDHTNLAQAIQFALANTRSNRHSRMLLLSDGYSTESLDAILESLINQHVSLDVRLISKVARSDFSVEALKVPSTVQPTEPFLIEAVVRGETDGKVSYRVLQNGEILTKGAVSIINGLGVIRHVAKLATRGATEYSIVIEPENDAFPGNNKSSQWVEVVGGPRILIISGYERDPLGPVLEKVGFEVQVARKPSELHVGALTGAKAVIINNFPAYHLPNQFLEALHFFVTEQGGGLLMVGGEHSFGSGGYFGSSIDDLMPVSMELRTEHRKFHVALVIVMDRSGSMGVNVGAGMSKMDLANDGAARSIQLLGDSDFVSVLAVDSAAHEILPLTSVGKNRTYLEETVRGVTSGGGGIFVFEGLKEAWKQLDSSPVENRHVILFSDAADSEEPGEYRTLIEKMVKQNTTVSVIALGSEFDGDAELLKD
ncbi:MAG: VWA domain-containing protein, partial [Bdellovibrionales bacterium]|nr:VWA domain-containing protein [Bdellovibrionales bacterium]